MARIPIALQLYSVRKDCEEDFPAVLDAVAEMGYEGVEFAGYYGRSARELRSMLDARGLKVAGTHTSLDSLLGDELEQTVEYNQVLGNRFLIVPGLPEDRRASRAAWLETARLFNEIADRLSPHGMVTGYHNHGVEFQTMDGEMPWDTFFRTTRREVVMQLDLGNALHSGTDPIQFLEKYPGRAVTIHLKDHADANDQALIGEGDVRWKDAFALIEKQGTTEWYIVEQESYAYPPLVCVRKCLQNVKRLLA